MRKSYEMYRIDDELFKFEQLFSYMFTGMGFKSSLARCMKQMLTFKNLGIRKIR